MRAVSTLSLLALALGSATGAPTGDLATASRAGAGPAVGSSAGAVSGGAPLLVRAPHPAAAAISREDHQQQERAHVVPRDSTSFKVAARTATTTSSCRKDHYKASNGTCIRCITIDSHALTCNSTTPLTCSDSFVPEGNKCVDATAERTAESSVTCRKDHYASSSGTCIKCVTIDRHALTCTSDAPLTCSDGYVVRGRSCVEPTERVTTAVATEATSTAVCRRDMYKAPDGSCIKCTTVDSRALTCTSKAALTCVSDYAVQDGRCIDARLVTTKKTTTASTTRRTTTSTTAADRRTTPATTTKSTTRSTTKSTTRSTTAVRTTTTSTGLNAIPQATTTTTTTSSSSPTATPTSSSTSSSSSSSTTKSTTSSVYYTRTAAGVATVVASGVGPGASQIVSGNAGGGLNWQASGYLARGGCPVNVQINNCWSMVLQATADLATTKRSLEEQEEGAMIEERYEEVGSFEPFHQSEPTFFEADAMPVWAGGPVDVNAQNLFRRADPRPVPNPRDFGSWPGDGEGEGDGGDGGDGDVSATPSPTPSPSPSPSPSASPTATTSITTTSSSSNSSSSPSSTSSGTHTASTTTLTRPPSTTSSKTTSTTTTTSTPTPTPRQRIEMYSAAAAAGTTWQYKWRSFVSTRTTTTRSFFHLWQLLRRDANGGAVVTLDGKSDTAVILDPIRGCGNACGSIPWSEFTGRTIQHSIQVTFGSLGMFFYVMSDGVTGEVLLTYTATGEMGAQASIKFGLYRAYVSGISVAEAWVGDFSMTQIF